MSDPGTAARVHMARLAIMRRVYPELFGQGERLEPLTWPLDNVLLGISAEDQPRADEGIADLVATPAAKRFVSAEPLLGFIGLFHQLERIDWVIVGGESGPGSRPMHPHWALSLRDQCMDAGVPFFFKQWGDWELNMTGHPITGGSVPGSTSKHIAHTYSDGTMMNRVGKRAAGALLDGREWKEMPR